MMLLRSCLMMELQNFYSDGTKTCFDDDSKRVPLWWYKKSSTITIPISLKRFLDDGTKTFLNDDTKKVP